VGVEGIEDSKREKDKGDYVGIFFCAQRESKEDRCEIEEKGLPFLNIMYDTDHGC